MGLTAEKIDIAWCDPGYVSGYFAVSLAATARDMEYHGCMGQIHREEGALLPISRNINVEKFLGGDAEWLWMVDSDMVFDKRHPMKLWETANEYGVNMVSGLAFIYSNGDQPVPSIFYAAPQDGNAIGLIDKFIPSGPSRVSATGLASSLVHREVFEVMGDGWFDMHSPDPDGEPTGEDVGFFLRARALGYDLMVDPSAETWHIKEMGLGREQWERYWELRGVDLEEVAKQVEAGYDPNN